jgi:hypothetical protein
MTGPAPVSRPVRSAHQEDSDGVFELGGHHAVGLMATHANLIETTNSIAFTTDMTTDAFALAAFTLTGAGILALAAAALSCGHRAWAGATVIVAVAMLVTAGAYAAGNDNVSDLMVFASGLVLLPGWLV